MNAQQHMAPVCGGHSRQHGVCSMAAAGRWHMCGYEFSEEKATASVKFAQGQRRVVLWHEPCHLRPPDARRNCPAARPFPPGVSDRLFVFARRRGPVCDAAANGPTTCGKS